MIRSNLTSITKDHVTPIAVAIAGAAGNDRQKTIELALRYTPTISEVLTTGQITEARKALLGTAAQPVADLNDLIKALLTDVESQPMSVFLIDKCGF